MIKTLLQHCFYLGRLQRPEVSNQGTLQVVTHIAFVAQLVEQWIEDPRVGGSTPSEGTTSLGLSGVNREPAEYGLLV